MVRDAAGLIGLLMVTLGCYLAWAPLALIVPGIMLVAVAVGGHLMSTEDDDAA